MVWDASVCTRLNTARKKNVIRFICGRLTDCEFIFYYATDKVQPCD